MISLFADFYQSLGRDLILFYISYTAQDGIELS